MYGRWYLESGKNEKGEQKEKTSEHEAYFILDMLSVMCASIEERKLCHIFNYIDGFGEAESM